MARGGLVDPGDQRAFLRVASKWDNSPDGLVNPAYRNNAISYFLGIHANPLLPQTVIAGDDRQRIAVRERVDA